MNEKLKKVGIGILGGLVLLAGIAMIALPGPAFVVIPAGLAILATQFEWARKWRDKGLEYIRNKRKQFSERRKHA